MILKKASAIAAIALAASLAAALPAQAQEKKIKYAHLYPATHYLYTEGAKIFQDKVTQATNGRIQFESYHAGQLGKGGASMLASRIVDTALLLPSFEPTQLPLTSVSELPGLYRTSCEATAKLWNIVKDGAPLNDAEYKPKGIKVLYVAVLPPYNMMTTGRKVASMKDMAGLKIRANGAAMDKTVQSLGAIPVRVAGPELYDALTRGTVDGAFWPVGATKTYGLEKVLRYLTKGPQLGSGSTLIGMNMKVWNALSAQDKAVFTQAAAETQKHLCAYMDKDAENSMAQLVKDDGLVVSTLSNDEMAHWQTLFEPIASGWAKEMDSTGRPGSALLKAFREAPGQ
jgi:TRAP-type C4-dicarboxylate transport system substrate-binding protein